MRRRAWGANEKWRNGGPWFNRTIQQVHVHHTVNSNDYAPEDVPALLRGIYRYHTKNLGWSDVGYNFLVDRFGGTWQGRAGGSALAVRGAHTLGFNSTSTGIAVIGNFEEVVPEREVISAIVRLAAWKLDKYDRKPSGRAAVFSQGSDKFSAGRKVKLPVIDGHRDTNDTACPGAHLYAQAAADPRARPSGAWTASAPPGLSRSLRPRAAGRRPTAATDGRVRGLDRVPDRPGRPGTLGDLLGALLDLAPGHALVVDDLVRPVDGREHGDERAGAGVGRGALDQRPRRGTRVPAASWAAVGGGPAGAREHAEQPGLAPLEEPAVDHPVGRAS